MASRVLGMTVVVVVAVLLAVARASELGDLYPEGWRMRDRFAGFRFECSGVAADPGTFAISVRDKAESLAGFGWVQVTVTSAAVAPTALVGGEFRGNPRTAKDMKAWLGTRDAPITCAALDYADTKIRYHFSHFKLMDSGRTMCFEDPPYACAATTPPDSDASHSEL